MRMLDLAVTGLCLVAAGFGIRRWLLVAQREGWALGAASRLALRWWTLDINAAVAVVALVSLVVAPLFRPSALTAGLAVVVGPFGLPLRGRHPGPLVWTKRARRASVVAAAGAVGAASSGLLVGTGTAALLAGVMAVLAPVLVDVGALAAGGPDPSEGAIPTGMDPAEALTRLVLGESGVRRVLVTAGPLGKAGEDLAERVTAVATHLLIVGRSARGAWRRGAARGPRGCTLVLCDDMDHAIGWIKTETQTSDLVVWLTIPSDHRP